MARILAACSLLALTLPAWGQRGEPFPDGAIVRELRPAVGPDTLCVTEGPRQLPLLGAYDVVVVGGGAAGVPAAVAAARNGARTCLIERYPFLGGTGTAGGVHVFMNTVGKGGLVAEVIERLQRDNARVGFAFDPEQYKLILQEMLLEAGVDVLYRCFAVGALVQPDRETGRAAIDGVIIESEAGRQLVRGRIVIDCTGDGDIAVCAGARYEQGRVGDGLTQPGTTMYVLEKTGPDAKRTGWVMPHGQVLINATRVKLDATNPQELTHAEIEGRRQTKKQVEGWEQKGYRLLHSGPQFGIRETRRIVGEYTLTEQDVLAGARFDDRIGRCSYPIDEHNPTGEAGTRLERVPAYDIPYRCLVPKDVENLLLAGRCISGDHIAMTSYRVMLPMMVVGQAAGTAAAICCEQEVTPRAVDVVSLQERLGDQGADLGLNPNDFALLSKGAGAEADSLFPLDAEHPDVRAELAIDGDESTRWLSDRSEEPHWIVVDLGRPRTFSRVKLHFYELGGGVYVIRSYRLERLVDGEWQTIAEARDQGQVDVTHEFDPVTAQKIRLYITDAAQRDSIARVREIEVLP